MDPLDHVRAGLDGTRCAVCDGPVPTGSTRILAHRDGLAFLQLDCQACGSTTLVFADDHAPSGFELERRDAAEAAPMTADDVLDMHAFLEAWRGGLADLVAPVTRSDLR
jgi:hypothetical protein